MTAEPILFFDLVIAVIILSLALVILVIYLSKLIKKFHSYLTEQEKLKTEIVKKESELFDQTRNQALTIIEEANNKALDIVKKANLFTNMANESFSKELINMLSDIRSKNMQISQNVSKNIEISALSEIKKFKETIEQETVDSEEMVKKKIAHEFSLAKKDIDIYKENQMKVINDQIYAIIQRVTEIILPKTITLTDHEQLILEALEQAKQEGIFSE